MSEQHQTELGNKALAASLGWQIILRNQSPGFPWHQSSVNGNSLVVSIQNVLFLSPQPQPITKIHRSIQVSNASPGEILLKECSPILLWTWDQKLDPEDVKIALWSRHCSVFKEKILLIIEFHLEKNRTHKCRSYRTVHSHQHQRYCRVAVLWTESPVRYLPKLGGKTVAWGWQCHRNPEWQEDSEKHIY